MPISKKTFEIHALFQKYQKDKDITPIRRISLKELQDADIELGGKDEGTAWRRRLKERIQELKEEELNRKNKQQQEIKNIKIEKRYLQNQKLAILGIVVTIIIALLTWFYFK